VAKPGRRAQPGQLDRPENEGPWGRREQPGRPDLPEQPDLPGQPDQLDQLGPLGLLEQLVYRVPRGRPVPPGRKALPDPRRHRLPR
jgi:hypothetical protein